MYKENLAFNILQELICRKTEPINQTILVAEKELTVSLH